MKAIKTAVIAAAITYLTILTAGAINPAWVGVATAAEVGAMAVGMAVVTGVGTLIASGIGMLTSRGINATGQNFGTKVAARDAQAPRQIVYGECRVGGTIVKITTSGDSNYKLHLAIALAGHEIQSLEEIYYNDELLATTSSTVSGETVYTVSNTSLTNSENGNAFGSGSLVRYTFHDGSQTAVDGVAYAAVVTDYPTTCKFQGIAYVYMEVIYDPEKNAGLPNLWFTVKGKKVYDPRTASTAYSNNPALIIRDYLSDTLYGLKAQSSEINDTNASGGFYSSADICDQTVTLPSGTEKRYTANGFTSASASGDGLLEGLLSSCSGAITYTNGQFNLFVGGDRTATLTITDEDLLGPVSISTRGPSGDLYNVVKSIFVDSTSKYEAMESPVYEDATFLAADTPSGESSANYKRILEMQLPFTSTNTMAQRLHTIGLIRQRQTASISLLTTVEYLKLQPSDWVKVTNTRLGYNEKTFEVISTTLDFLENDGNIFAATRLNLQEIDDAVYDYDAADYLTPVADGANPYGGSKAIEAPTNLAISQINAQEGTVAKISVQISWTNRDDNAIQGTEIQYRLSTDAADDYKAAGQAGRGISNVVFAGAVVGDQYYVRVRHFSFDNVVSGWTSPVNIIIAEPDTITAPTSVSASTGKLGFIEIGFTAPAVDSVSSVNIYFSTSSGFTPSAGNLLTSLAVNKGNVRTHNVGLANGLDYATTYYFKLTALNNYSSESSASSEVSGSFTKVDTGDIVDGAVDVAKFASSIEPVTLVTSVPSTKSTEVIYNTTNNTLYRWDGSAYVAATGVTDFSQLSGNVTAAQFAATIEPVSLVTSVPSSKTTEVIYNTTNNKLYRWDGSAYAEATGVTNFSQLSGNVTAAQFAATIQPVTLVTSVPSTKSTETIYNTTNNTLYRWDGSAYVTVQGATDFSQLTGTVQTAQIAAAAITATQLGTAAVEAGNIAANAVTTAKIAALAVNSAKIAANAITTAKIAADAVTAAELADNAATEAVIATNAITATKISDGAIETAKLAAGAVTAAKITAGTITASQIASATILAGNIATGTITAGQIAANTITASEIAAGAITATEILTGTITALQIAANAITASEIAANTITASQIAVGAISATEIAAGAVTTAKLDALAITADKIASNAITTSKISAGAVTAASISAGTITAAEIATNTITAGQIAAGAIATTELAVGAVGTINLADDAITAAKILDGSITATLIGDGQIVTSKLGANAVTAAKITAGTITATQIATGTITATQIASNTITAGQIAAGAISTSELAVGAVGSTNIANDAVTAAKILDGSITATLIGDGQIVTSKLNANAVTAAKIAAGTITATQIATGTITATQIASNTITAGQIAAGAITATEIAADAISVAKLISNTSKTYGNFKFEMGTNTTVAGFQGAGIFRTGQSYGFGLGGLANAASSVAIMGQQAHNSTEAYGSYFANSLALGSSTHRSQAGLCNNARAGIFADAATTVNYTHLCNGTYAVLTTGNVYVDGDITATGTITPFTGMHDGLLADDVSPEIGDILVDSSVAIKRNIANTLFVMAVSGSTNQSAIGIYAGDRESAYVPVSARLDKVPTGIEDSSLPERDPTYDSVFTDRKTVVVNSLGEGQVNVCGQGGDIAAGDLIVTSSVVGKGMKQSDDILRGCTVAKARESVTFTDASDIRQIACIYLCG